MQNLINVKEKVKKIIITVCNFFDYIFKESIFRRFFQFFPNNIFLFILSIIIISTSIGKIQNNIVYLSNGFSNYDGNFIKGKEIIQELDVKKIDYIEKIGLRIGTYQRINDSNYELIIKKDNIDIIKKDFNAKKLKDNEFNYLNIGKIEIDKDSKYVMVIRSLDATKDNAIAIGYSFFEDDYNKDEIQKQYSYKIPYVSDFNDFIKVIFIILLTIFFLTNYVTNKWGILQNKFLSVIFIYSIFTLFLIPPFEIPDEDYHFQVSYAISKFDFSKSLSENTYKEFEMPKNIKCLKTSFYNDESYFRKKDITDCLKSESANTNITLGRIGFGKVICYLVPAIAIKITSLFTNSPMIMFFMGRLFNFLLSFMIIVFAFKIMPKHKNILLIIVSIPMFIQQMVSYSYDALLNSLCILVIAYLMKFYYSVDKIKTKEFIIYSVVSFVIYIIKAPYLIIPLLIIFLDSNKFGDKKIIKYVKVFIMATVIILSTKIINKITYVKPIKHSSPAPDSGKQIAYLLSNPKNILKIIYCTFKLKLTEYLVGLIGLFGNLKYRFDWYLILSYYIFFIFVILSDNINMKLKMRIKNIISLLILFGGIFAALYLGWSSYMLPYVEGVQGRYFIPLLAPFMICVLPNKKLIDIKDSTVQGFINIIFVSFISTLLIIYY